MASSRALLVQGSYAWHSAEFREAYDTVAAGVGYRFARGEVGLRAGLIWRF